MRAGVEPVGLLAGALAEYELTLVSKGNPHGATLSRGAGRRQAARRPVSPSGHRDLSPRAGRALAGAPHVAGRLSGADSWTTTRPLPPAFASYIARSASRMSSAAVAPGRE